MSNSARSPVSGPSSIEERATAHDAATAAFVESVPEAALPGLVSLYVFGSVARRTSTSQTR